MTLKPALDTALLEEIAEDLYEHAPCGYVSTLEDGTIVKLNQTLLNWLGLEREETLYKKRFQELLSIGGRIFFETHFAPLLQMQGFANEISFDLQGKNKQQIPVLTSTIQRRNSKNATVVNRITVFNITDRKKYERELLLERQKAQKAARVKADFLSLMSHEIRTPMNAVIGIATLLERTHLSEQQREYTSMLKTSSENLMNLLNSILDFSKIEAGKVALDERNFELKKLLEDVTRGLEAKAQEKGLAIRIHLQGPLPPYLVGDQFKIAQVLTNFIGNAIKFTEKGSIDVSAKSLGATESVASIRFEVSDTGIGISPDRLPHIFDEFTQADYEIGLKYGGSGLGLAISNKIVEMHGSKIAVESRLGEGSKFSFDLHLKIGVEEAPCVRAVSGIQESGILTGVRVLVAEDNEDNAYIVERLLRGWGAVGEFAINGRVAIEKLKAASFDVVLMDLRMPLMNGYEATTAIRALEDPQLSKIPIIAFSASTKVGEEDMVQVTEFDDVIAKPFRPDELFSKIAYYTGRSKTTFTGPAEVSLVPDVSEPTDENELFTLNGYMESLDGDRESVNEILRLVINSYTDAQRVIASALKDRDLAAFEFQAHRIRASMELLQARPLKRALELGRGALLSGESLDAATGAIEKAFSATTKGLREKSEQRS